MHAQWQHDAASVDSSWQNYFENGANGSASEVIKILSDMQGGAASPQDVSEAQSTASKVLTYIRNYAQNGHLRADLDPLEMEKAYSDHDIQNHFKQRAPNARVLDLEYYGLTAADLDRKLYIDLPGWSGLLATKKHWTLRELRDALDKAYCGKVGAEYLHLHDRETCNWIRDKIELR